MILSIVVLATIVSVASAGYIPAQYGPAAISYAPAAEISYGYAATPVLKAAPAYHVAKPIPVQIAYAAPTPLIKAAPVAYGPAPAVAHPPPPPTAYAAYPAYGSYKR